MIGVITSPTGAVIRDILHRIADRFPRHVLVWPVRVQGETSADEVANAIRGFNDLTHDGAIPRPDVLIVARGGGSLEDLWSFNEETVLRAVAASDIPLISAVGHETDTTLIDFVSDHRSPTPTAAAEKAVPVRADLAVALAELGARLNAGSYRLVARKRADFKSVVRVLPQPDTLLAPQRQRLDMAAQRLPGVLQQAIDRQHKRMADLSRRLGAQSPAARLARFGERLSGFGVRLKTGITTRIARETQDIARRRDKTDAIALRLHPAILSVLTRRHDRVASQFQFLASLGYKQVLARGYALVRGDNGVPLRSHFVAAAQKTLAIEFSDGRLVVNSALSGASETTSRPATRPAAKADQGLLF